MLIPSNIPHKFGSEQAAKNAIQRTEATANKIKGSLVDSMEKLKPLVSLGAWEIKRSTTK